MNRKWFVIFSYGSIGIILVFLILMIARLVPGEWFIYILGISIFLMLVRFAFRVYFVLQDKKEKE